MKTTIHSSKVHTLAEEEKLLRGPKAFMYRALLQDGKLGWLTDRHIGCIRTTQISEEVSLLPDAIDCLRSCIAGSEQGTAWVAVYRNPGQRLIAMSEWWRARVV